jgi:hypothetical protein
MLRWNPILLLIAAPLLVSGCSMCCGPYDYEYPIMESVRYPRTDPEYGRVGSVFSDPNVTIGEKPRTNADVPREDDRLEDIESELDDPDFNLETESTPPAGDDVDTSAGNFRGWR